MAYSAQQLTALTAQVFQDPHVKQILEAWHADHARTGVWGRGTMPGSYERQLNAAMTAAGLPPDTRVDFSGPTGEPVVTNRGLPNWAFPLIIGGAIATAGLATGAFAAPAAASAASGTGSGAGLLSGTAIPSSVGAVSGLSPVAPALASAAPAATTFGSGETGTMIGAEGPGWGGTESSPWLSTLKPTGRDVVGAGRDAISALLANRSKKKEQQLEESRLNPYRGVQQQAQAAGSLDMMANMDFASAPTSIAGRYGDVAGPAASGFTWNPDPQTRGTAAAGLALVRGGQGRNPSVTGTPSPAPVSNAPPYTPPAAPPSATLPLWDRRRRLAAKNPWLEEDPYAVV